MHSFITATRAKCHRADIRHIYGRIRTYAYVNIHRGVNVCIVIYRIRMCMCAYTCVLVERRTHTGRPVRATRGRRDSQLAHSSGRSGRKCCCAKAARLPLFVSYQLARWLAPRNDSGLGRAVNNSCGPKSKESRPRLTREAVLFRIAWYPASPSLPRPYCVHSSVCSIVMTDGFSVTFKCDFHSDGNLAFPTVARLSEIPKISDNPP